jgi:hypothetical protein
MGRSPDATTSTPHLAGGPRARASYRAYLYVSSDLHVAAHARRDDNNLKQEQPLPHVNQYQ